MRIATYNFCQGGADFEATHRVLAALDADILLAQELRDLEDYLTHGRRTWRDLGYCKPLWRPVFGHRRWGSAIFVKDGVLDEIPTPEPLTGWVVGAKVTSLPNSEPLTVFSIHTPTRESNYYPWQAQEVLEYLETQRSANQVVGGDFNVIISDPGPASTRTDNELEQQIRIYLRRTLGLVNCWQTIHPNTPLPTTYHGCPQAQSHIDGLFISPGGVADLTDCWVMGAERETWSEGDHYPVIATFDAMRPAFSPRVLRRAPATRL
jgi:exonuclease III